MSQADPIPPAPAAPSAASPKYERLALLAGMVLALVLVAFPAAKLPRNGVIRAVPEFRIGDFERLPVLLGGRVKPMDTVARTSLASISGKSRVYMSDTRSADGDGHRIAASQWLLDTMAGPTVGDGDPIFHVSEPDLRALVKLPPDGPVFCSYATLEASIPTLDAQLADLLNRPQADWSLHDRRLLELRVQLASYQDAPPPRSDSYPIFRIENPQVLTIFNRQKEDGRYYSFFELAPNLQTLESQASEASSLPAEQRDPYQRDILSLYSKLTLYHQLRNALVLQGRADPLGDLEVLAQGIAEHGDQLNRHDAETLMAMPEMAPLLQVAVDWQRQAGTGNLRVIPSQDSETLDWQIAGEAVLGAFSTGTIPPPAKAYVELVSAWRSGDAQGFNLAVQHLHEQVDTSIPVRQRKVLHEVTFNYMQPFITAMWVYVVAFLAACMSWLALPGLLRPLARGMVLVALVVHTAGLVTRVYLQGYAPVTNLYSSAVFVGWAAVLVGVILERLHRNGVGSAAAGFVGFVTLIIAHMLSLSGDTMEMMRAVLDSNFWLGTHVVTVTIGYSGMFLAGLLGVFFLLRGLLDRHFDRETAKSMGRMVYGVICFSTLFSFVGTVLGGIWADQSWGRFWGWDPKENGALLIVLWCAVILHARWGGYVGDRGVALLAVFGNIITAFSWFGVNMLEVGLHSYGFMSGGAFWLRVFYLSQIAVIMVGALPFSAWRSPYGQAQARRAQGLRDAYERRCAPDGVVSESPARQAAPPVD